MSVNASTPALTDSLFGQAKRGRSQIPVKPSEERSACQRSHEHLGQISHQGARARIFNTFCLKMKVCFDVTQTDMAELSSSTSHSSKSN